MRVDRCRDLCHALLIVLRHQNGRCRCDRRVRLLRQQRESDFRFVQNGKVGLSSLNSVGQSSGVRAANGDGFLMGFGVLTADQKGWCLDNHGGNDDHIGPLLFHFGHWSDVVINQLIMSRLRQNAGNSNQP